MRTLLPSAAVVLACLVLPSDGIETAAGQEGVPGEGTLLEWLGLESGQSLSFVDGHGEPVCVRVGEAIRIGDRSWAPLQGLPWPGLPTDSQVLLPLDGSLFVGVIRTPGPRPLVEPLIAGPDSLADSLPFLADGAPVWIGEVHLDDGWYAIGGSPGEPEALLYVWCARCMDAGTKVLFERGRGIAFVESMTIAGSEVLMRGEEVCAAPEVELQLYVDPAPARDP